MKNSTMPQKLVRLKPKELIGRYVDFLGRMQFDKAREFAELEKMRTNWMDFQTVDERHWPAFMAILAQLANLDSLYFSLSYLLSKFSFRKENNIKDVYTQLRSELVQIVTDGNREKLADNLQSATTVQQLADQFMQFVSIRAGLVEFYTLLSIKNWRAFDEELQQLLNGKLWQWMEQEGESAAGNLFAACRNELTVLSQLHAAQRAMQECDAFEALLSLKRSANLLDNWFHALDASPILKPSGPSSFFAAFSSRRRSSISRFGLLQFLLQFHHTMVAKFSLYFHDTLIPYVPGAEMKQAYTMPVSYLQLFHTFFRKSNAHTVCLLLNRIDQDTPFQGFGYHYASTSTQIFLERNADDKLKASQYSSTAEGEATKQAELPLKKDCRSGLSEKYPALLWISTERRHDHSLYATICSFVQEGCAWGSSNVAGGGGPNSGSNTNLTAEASGGKIRYLYDRNKEQTFFTACIEANIHLVVTYERRVQERDGAVHTFFGEALASLRCTKLFQEIRSMGK